MRKFTFIALLTILCASSYSQITYEATPDYGKLWNITYDQNVANKLYALTLVNHLMVSTDNGISWNILYTFPNANTYLTALKIVPGGKALSFVVSHDPDLQTNGLYIFDLATNTVSKHFTAPNFAKDPSIVAYSIYSELVNTVLINTSYSENFSPFTKVYYTVNNGTEWSQIYFSADDSDVQINNAVIAPGDSTKLFLARGLGSHGANGGLFVSYNSGKDWIEKLHGKAIDPITFNPTDTSELFAGSAIKFNDAIPEALYHSVNGGNTFNTVPIAWTDQTLNNITTIKYDPVNLSIMWLLEENEYGKSVDGGSTWTMKAFPPDDTTYSYGTSITINPFNSSQLFITSDGWPQFSNDGGTVLTKAKNPFYLISGIAYGNYATSQDLYYSSQNGYLHKNLTTGNTNAYSILSPFTVSIASLAKTTIVDSTVPGRVFIYMAGDGFSSNSVLSYSDDYGATTTSLPCDDFSTGIQFIEKDPSTPNQYWVSYSYYGSSSSLFKLNFNNPANPVATPVTMPGTSLVTAIAISPVNANVAYLAQGVDVYKTVDGGLSWTGKINGLGGLMDGTDIIWDIKDNPLNRNQFIIATNHGLFLSNDSAENWSLALAGSFRKVSFSPLVNGQIIAGVYSSVNTQCQLYYTVNGGTNWLTVLPETLFYLQSIGMDFKFNTTSIDIYFETSDLGIVKYSLTGLTGPLPLSLFYFTGYLKNNNVQLLWNTANEHNILQYKVERSIDGQNFEEIGAATANNTSGNHTYNYVDHDFSSQVIKSGMVFYRLKIRDIDGHLSYSSVVKLTGDNNVKMAISISPNPVSSMLNVQLQTVNTDQYGIMSFDAAGKEFINKKYNLSAGNSSISIPAGDLPKGVYTLVVSGKDGDKKQVRFVKN